MSDENQTESESLPTSVAPDKIVRAASTASEQDGPTSITSEINDDPPDKKETKQKIDILLKPTGNAPILKRKKWNVEPHKTIGWVNEFIRKYLRLQDEERIFLYVNQTFAPSPDQTIGTLYDCYKTDNKLILHYCKTQAWG